ncbi:MAG: UvrD-helicase domain-containing protein [Bacteroidales bacterium]|nr:UvrD-helicase domain-containing protein [Bacteroidales bacterium]
MEDKVNAILEGLNDEQKKAVSCTEGPVLIVAGAGSGKTRVLTSRVAYILASGAEPSGILALTFTKKAASEMKERISLMVGPRSARRVVMGTFHSVFLRFLREYADLLGYPGQFTIYDSSDSQSAMKACIKELGLDDKIYKPKEILSHISIAKNNLITVQGYRNNPTLITADAHAKKPRTADLYELYQTRLKQAGVMDFDDILLQTNYLFKDHPEALESIASRFTHILVDEYQDTNYAQYLILRRLAGSHHNICVVGDDSQSIYAFRGAKIENILKFRKDYPESRIFRLERNYRSTATIVEAANSVIEKNESRIPKECYSTGGRGEPIKLIKTYSETEEAVAIVAEILSRMRTDHAQYQDFAILYRTNAQSRAIEEQLRRRNIPYMIYSGNSFFERAEVKDMMAYFKLCVNPNDDESFKRIVNKPARGIGDTSLSALNECARAHGCSLFKAAFQPDTESFGLREAARGKILTFCRMIDGLAAIAPSSDAHDLAVRIADESGLYAFYKADNSIEGMARSANVEELLNSVEAFVEEKFNEMDEDYEASSADEPVFTLNDFLENVTLLSNVDVAEDEEDSGNRVALMTVHTAKGLEFPYVFIAGLEENLFPNVNLLSSRDDIEEERRLFYVALTRAKLAATLTFAVSRMRNGKHESNSPSRFIREINPRYIDNPLSSGEYTEAGRQNAFWPHSSRLQSPRPQQSPRPMPSASRPAVIDKDFVPTDMSELRTGERIEHNRFGKGTILSLSGTAPDMKANIRFDEYGEKLLLLKYAKVRHLE